MLDVSVWQSIYEELNDPNFVIISAAQDTGGEAAAGYVFDEAKATYIQIIDTNHIISSAFNFINVPSAAWIDEAGNIVRIDEGTYAKKHEFGGTDDYAPALKDWVKNGTDSQYVQSAKTVTKNIRSRSADEEKAEPAFRLGNYFRNQGEDDKADAFWKQAQSLNPDSINFLRQDLSFTEEGSGGETFRNHAKALYKQGKAFYRPLDMGGD